MIVERPLFHRPDGIQISSGLGLEGSDPLATVSVGVEASSPSKYQGVHLAPSTTAPDDEVPAVTHSPGLPRGVPVVCKGSGGLLTHVLLLPPGLGCKASSERWPPCGDFGGGVLAVSRQQNISLRS